MKKSIVVTFTMPGFHRWEDAPNEVGFLRSTHRHLFKFKLFAEVKDSDREQEFFIMQRHFKHGMAEMFGDDHSAEVELGFGPMSCEMIAERMLTEWRESHNVYRVEVWEDDENGGIVEL